MGNWIQSNLSNVIATIESGSRPKGGVTIDSGEVPSLGGENIIQTGGVSLRIVKKVSLSFFEKMTKGHLQEGDVLINKDGANTGKLGIYREYNFKMACINEHLFLIRAKNEVDNSFLYYYLLLENTQQIIKNKISGSAQPGLNSGFIKNFPFQYPESKEEQAIITTILFTIEKNIEKTEQIINKYERIKTGMMHDILVFGIDEDGNVRTEETHEFKDSALGRVPVDWKVETIGQSCRVQNSFRKPLSAEVRESMKGKYPYYGPTGILDYINEYRVDGKFVLLGEDGDHFLKFKSQEMTLLVSGKYNVNNHAHILEGKNDCLTEWIHCFFCHRDLTAHLLRQGAGRFKLNKSTLLKLYIAKPRIEEQHRIIEKINQLSSFLQKEKDALSKLGNLKKALMQDLLIGKVRVDSLNLNPVSL